MSPKYTLSKADGIKIAQAFGFAMASAALAFSITLVEQVDFGEYVFLVPLINVILYTLKKFVLSDNSVVNKTGNTELAVIGNNYYTNSAPTTGTGNVINFNTTDNASNKPKLVVEHSAATPTFIPRIIMS